MNKVAIVTGASRGIGRSIALRLAQDKYHVVVNYNSSESHALDVVSEVSKIGAKTIAVKADVSKLEEVENLFNVVEKEFGKVDILINNAGVLNLKLIENFDEEAFNRIIDVNLKGTFNTLRLASNRLNSGGSIINLSSSAIGLALPGYAVYNASKAAVESLSNTFAKELRGRSIRVNCVAPGPTATELFLDGKNEEQIEYFKGLSPLERLGEPEDIASVISFLASDESSWINAQVLRANGGIV